MKKFFKSLLLVLIILPMAFIFTACGKVTIVDIQKTNSTDLVDIYTVYYSDGTTSSITIQNGKDGSNFDVEALFQMGVARGAYTDDLAGYQKFLMDLTKNSSSTIEANNNLNKALQSAVSIYTIVPSNNSTAIACGSGVIYQMDETYSYILTNYHVLYNALVAETGDFVDDVYIFQYGVDCSIVTNSRTNKQEIKGDYVLGKYIAGSMTYDVAVVEVKTADLVKNNSTVRAADIATSYHAGDQIYAIGNPEGDGISITKGIVSVESENIQMTAVDGYSTSQFRVARIDAAINGGNSGGGVFNENGELIGLVNSKSVYAASDETTPIDGMAYALPIDNVKCVADNLMYYYSVNKKFSTVYKLQLGVYFNNVDKNTSQVYNPVTGECVIYDQIVVASDPELNAFIRKYKVQETGKEATYIQTGDIITHIIINDKTYKLDRYFYLENMLLSVRPGDNVAFIISRGNVSLTTGSVSVQASDLVVKA